MPRVTLQTVADEVGVSKMTVSNAYARPDQLRPDLRRSILAAAERLGYPGPHATARSLSRGRTGAVGVVLTETLGYAFEDPYAVAFLRGLALGLAPTGPEDGFGLLLVPTPPGRAAESAVAGAAVDGFCLFSLSDGHPALLAALRRGLPTVLVDEPGNDTLPFVGVDDRGAARAAAEHLLALGHRRLGVVVDRLVHDDRHGFVDPARLASATYPANRERVAGVRDAVAVAGLAPKQVVVVEVPPNSRASGRRAAGLLLDRPDPCTAVVAASDVLALGVLDVARDRGIGPDRLSVTGFDDIAAAADHGLTTVRQPSVGKGEAAARLLRQVIAGAADTATPVLLPTELVVRTSTAPPRSAR